MDLLQKISNKKALLILGIIGFIVYLTIFTNGFVGDDKEQIYNFTLVHGLLDVPKVFLFHHVVLGAKSSLLGSYYKPLMLFYFYTIRGIFGINPFFYHAPQIILVVINSFFVYLFFSKFFKKYLAFFLALLFLVHPINQEVAAYISNIQEVLFFFFGMLAVIISAKNNYKTKDYFLIFIFLLLSLLAKESGILFLAIFITYAFIFKKAVLKKNIVVSGAVLTIYFVFRFFSKDTSAFWIEPPPMAAVPLMERIMHIPSLFLYYLKTFFYPDILSFNQQWVIKKFDFQSFLLPLFFDLLFLGFIFALFWIRKRILTNKNLLLFFTIWILLGLLPHLQILPLDATVATRWFYFSSVGIIGILGVICTIILARFKSKSNLLIVVFIVLLIVLALRTMARNTQWKNAFTLYSTDSNISQSPLLENNLGDEYFKIGDYKNAKVHFQKALSLNPDLWIAVNNLGILAEKKGDYKTALKYYNMAYKKADRLPVAENIARVLLLSERRNLAEKFSRQKLLKYPFSAKLLLTLALALYEEGKYEEALAFANKSFEISPDAKTQTVIKAIFEKLK